MPLIFPWRGSAEGESFTSLSRSREDEETPPGLLSIFRLSLVLPEGRGRLGPGSTCSGLSPAPLFLGLQLPGDQWLLVWLLPTPCSQGLGLPFRSREEAPLCVPVPPQRQSWPEAVTCLQEAGWAHLPAEPAPPSLGSPMLWATVVGGPVPSHPEATAAMLVVLAPYSHCTPVVYLVMNTEGKRDIVNYILKPWCPHITLSKRSSMTSLSRCPHPLPFSS